jgi:putative endopeptidase
METATIPPYETSYSLGWSKMRDQLEADVISVLEKDSGEAGIYYKSCLNTEAVEKQGMKGIHDWLQAADEVKSMEDLTEFMITAELFDFSVFFSTGVSIDQLDPKHYITSLSRGRLTLPGRQYYENSGAKYERIRSTFLEQATKMFKLSGLSEPAASENARNVMDIETELAKGMVSKAKLRKMNQKLTTIPELDALCPSVQWAHFFRELEMHPVLQTCNGTDAGRCGVVAMREPSYFSHLETAVLRRFDLAAIRSFLRWRVIRVFTPYLSEAFRNEAHLLRAEIYGVSENSPAPKRCFRATVGHLPDETSKLYVEAFFPHATAVDARWMLERIRAQYSDGIARLDWMDGATRARAQRKLAAMGFEVGFPAGWRELLRLPPLALAPDRLLENTLLLMVRSSHREREKLGEAVDRERWSRPPAVVNAFYSPDRNALFIPAGILQPPFYLPGGAPPRNYGGIGSVLGHEISHSLDDSGSRYDEEGRLAQWWDDGTLARFRDRTRCVARQYGAFTDVQGEHLNGNLTLGETIADGGVRPAPRAPRPAPRAHSARPALRRPCALMAPGEGAGVAGRRRRAAAARLVPGPAPCRGSRRTPRAQCARRLAPRRRMPHRCTRAVPACAERGLTHGVCV